MGRPGLRHRVMLEFLAVELVDDVQGIERVRAGARLLHPHIANTVDFGTARVDGADHWYVARELVRGVPLHRALEAGPLHPRAALRAAVEICSALAEIHATSVDAPPSSRTPDSTLATLYDFPPGDDPLLTATSERLVHRSLRPESLWLSTMGFVKLYGPTLAGLSTTAARAHTGYRPPEQWRGQEDHRCDLFALGATLVELLTGHRALPQEPRPSEAELIELLTQAAARAEAMVSGLGDVLARCLHPDPEQRWARVEDLQPRLQALWSDLEGPGLVAVVQSLTPNRATPSSLPSDTEERDRFFGRTEELARIAAHLEAPDRPVLVLLGPGGIGKTRLAVVAALAHAAVGGTVLVDLSTAHTAKEVGRITADALRFEPGHEELVSAVGRHLATLGPALLVLDNLEQLADEMGGVLAAWTAAAPEVSFLCTSRVDLHLSNGRTLTLGPLDGPSAVELFRARASRQLTEPDATVQGLVQALDGMPLAIELAASRVRTLSVRQILQRLDEQLRLLAAPRSDRPQRHRSMRAALQGSYDLLSDAARAALAQLSVFDGSFDLDAATAVLDLTPWPDAWPVGVLGELVDASLLRPHPRRGRFSMLVVVRQFAATWLDREVAARIELRHGRFYARLGSPESLGALNGPGGEAHRQALGRDLDNLRVAWRRAVQRGDRDVATPTSRAAWSVLIMRGPLAESGEMLEAAFSLEQQPDRQAALLSMLASTQRRLGQHQEVITTVTEALRITEAAGLRRRASLLLPIRARSFHTLGDLDAAMADTEAALALCDDDDDGQRHRGRLAMDLGNLAHTRGDQGTALAYFSQALEVARAYGDEVQLPACVASVGMVQTALGDRARGRANLEEGLQLALDQGNLPIVGWVRTMLGRACLADGDLPQAWHHHELALQHYVDAGAPMDAALQRSALAAVLLRMDRTNEALEHSQQAVAVMRATGPLHELTRALGLSAEALSRRGQPEAALEAASEAVSLAEEADLSLVQARERIRRARILQAHGHPDAAQLDRDVARRILQAWPAGGVRDTLLAELAGG
ncbi:MAG: tetratricopeptide repeat protein [Myxococcales bacterium]|nr:tetratricopeptide repeat protein [Myxococcales bacterium]